MVRAYDAGPYDIRRQIAYPSQSASAVQPPASVDLHLSSSEYVSSSSHSDDSTVAVPFAQLLSNAAAGGSDWKVLHPKKSPNLDLRVSLKILARDKGYTLTDADCQMAC